MSDKSHPQDLFEFMRNAWNPQGFPFSGMAAGLPTVDVAEIEKKIAEMKTVEAWLTTNLGFVQMTIKTLEAQKAALESLRGAPFMPPSEK